MPKPQKPDLSEWLPRIRCSPEDLKRLEAHVERYRSTHPYANISQWVREAIAEKIEADLVTEKRSRKKSA